MAWAPDYVVLEDLKDFLRIDAENTESDVQLALAITTSSRSVDSNCNRQFGSAPGTRTYTKWWYDYAERKYVFSIDDLMPTDPEDDPLMVEADGVALAAEDYELLPRNAQANGKPWTHIALKSYVARLDITADPWGWTAIPESVQQATMLQAHRFVIRRDSPFGIAGSPDQGSELRLLAKLDPDVAVSLIPFKRMRMPG